MTDPSPKESMPLGIQLEGKEEEARRLGLSILDGAWRVIRKEGQPRLGRVHWVPSTFQDLGDSVYDLVWTSKAQLYVNRM